MSPSDGWEARAERLKAETPSGAEMPTKKVGRFKQAVYGTDENGKLREAKPWPPMAPVAGGGGMSILAESLPDAQRWQYAVVNVGAFGSAERMAKVLSDAGSAGWELITVYDKASNWLGGMEKGFMLLKRAVPDGVKVDKWCLVVSG